MAGAPDVVEKGLEKEITCPICHDRFREPKILPCLHYYCKECVRQLALRAGPNRPFACPECRSGTVLPQNDPDQLPTAFFVNRMIELYEKTQTVCEMCSKAKAEAFCHQCTDFLCNNCVGLHKTLKVFAGHKVMTLKEAPPSMSKDPRQLEAVRGQIERAYGSQLMKVGMVKALKEKDTEIGHLQQQLEENIRRLEAEVEIKNGQLQENNAQLRHKNAQIQQNLAQIQQQMELIQERAAEIQTLREEKRRLQAEVRAKTTQLELQGSELQYSTTEKSWLQRQLQILRAEADVRNTQVQRQTIEIQEKEAEIHRLQRELRASRDENVAVQQHQVQQLKTMVSMSLPETTTFSNFAGTGTAVVIICLYVFVLGMVCYWFVFKQRTASHHRRYPEHRPNEPLYHHHKFSSRIWFMGDPWQETVTSKGMCIRWNEIGIKIDIPPGAVLEDKPITVTVRPCLSGPFALPQGYELASPVYVISQSSEFQKTIQLFMAHFANLESDEDCEEMTFLTSRLSQRLEIQQRGAFQIGTQEGIVSLDHFCKKAIARKRHQPNDSKELQESAKRSERNWYSVQLYQNAGDYAEENVAAVCVSLYHPAYIENFKRCLEEWYPPPFRFRPSAKVVKFSKDKMVIKVPTDILGWKIVPDVQPCEISREEVDLPSVSPHLDYSTVCTYPPKILLTISPLSPTELSLMYCPLSIKGFVQKLEFNLQLKPPQKVQPWDMSPERQPTFHVPPSMVDLTTVNIIGRISTNYRPFGIVLLQDHNGTIVDGIVHKHLHDTEEIISEILRKWLNGKGMQPVSWQTLIRTCRDVGLETLASDIEHTIAL